MANILSRLIKKLPRRPSVPLQQERTYVVPPTKLLNEQPWRMRRMAELDGLVGKTITYQQAGSTVSPPCALTGFRISAVIKHGPHLLLIQVKHEGSQNSIDVICREDTSICVVEEK